MAIEVEEIDITPYKVAGKVALQYDPIPGTSVAVDPIGGPAQVEGEDFNLILETREITWDLVDSDIKAVLDEDIDVILRVVYERD